MPCHALQPDMPQVNLEGWAGHIWNTKAYDIEGLCQITWSEETLSRIEELLDGEFEPDQIVLDECYLEYCPE